MSAPTQILVVLDHARGPLKRCRWCASDVGVAVSTPDRVHAGFVSCGGCDRNIAWLSAKQVRRLIRRMAA